MGGCNSSMKKKPVAGREYTLAILGLDNAGKTTAVKRLKGEDISTVAPTIGFSNEEMKFAERNIMIYDLGGGRKFRDVWQRYFGEVYGIIYVVDASKQDRLEETREVLGKLMEHPKICRKPILILGNKQDVDGAMDEIDIVHGLGVESMANKTKTPCRIELCSTSEAINNSRKSQGNAIKKGFEWLIDSIDTNYESLRNRVTNDVEAQKLQEKREKEEKMERVKKIREERAKEEKKNGKQDSDEGYDEIDSAANPFKPINDTIKNNDERLRKEKSQSGKGTAKSPGLDDFGKRSFTSRDQENMPPANSRNKEELSNTPFSKGKSNGLALSKDDSIRGKLPSYDDSFTRKNSSYDDSNQRGLSSSVSQGNLSNRLGKGTPLLSPLKPLSLEDSKQKKKPKKNQTIPFDGDSNGSQTSISGMQMGATLRPVEGDRLARSNTLQRLNQQQLYSARNYGGGETYDKRNSRASDEEDNQPSWRRKKPNYDDDIET